MKSVVDQNKTKLENPFSLFFYYCPKAKELVHSVAYISHHQVKKQL